MTMLTDKYDKLIDLAKRRGIFWLSFEIYGGVGGFYDFGPVGVLIKRNIMNQWLRYFVYTRENIVEVETPVVNPRVIFKASGHEDHFTDPILECSKCGRIYRADHLIKDLLEVNVEGWSLEEIDKLVKVRDIKCPDCGGDFNPAFNALLLFATNIGPYKGELAYLKPEHAQGMFINFPHILKITRNKLPLGIAQVGRVARNEISPRQGLLRLREFTIMEIEFFFDPEEVEREISEVIGEVENEELRIVTTDMRNRNIEDPLVLSVKEVVERKIVKTPWLAYWMGIGNKFLRALGISSNKMRFVEKLQHERAHYSAQTFDQEVYTSRFGWIEVAGYAYRTSYDLEKHAEFSKNDFTFFKRYEKPLVKHVSQAYPNPEAIEKEFGSDRLNEIMKKLAQRSPEELYRELEIRGYVEVNGLKISHNCFYIKKEEVRIHGKKIYPHVVEPSFGLERLLYIVLEHAYDERDEKVVLRLPPVVAPYHVAVFPLLTGRKPEHVRMTEIARNIYRDLIRHGYRVLYDEEGSIGRRYARADEIGVPYAITVDHQTLEDSTVTIRNRDTTQQMRIHINNIHEFLLEKFSVETIIY